MKSKKIFLVSAAALMLLGSCGGNPEESSATPSSGAQSSVSQSSSNPRPSSSSTPAPTSSTPISSTPAPVNPLLPAYYVGMAFNSYEGSTRAVGEQFKWDKGTTYKWTFNLNKAEESVTFAIGVRMTNDSHSTRTLFTNSVGADSSDSFESNSANDGTPRLSVKINGIAKELTNTRTYGESGLSTGSVAYLPLTEFAVNAGPNVVELSTHAQCGYRLYFGEGEARLYSDDQALALADPAVVSSEESIPESSESISTEPLEEEEVTVSFGNIADTVMVSPKIKDYVDAMHTQEATLEYPYRLTPLYGPDDFGYKKPDQGDGYTGYTDDELGGVDVCTMLNRNDYGNKTENYPIQVSFEKGDLEYNSARIEFWPKANKDEKRSVAVTGTAAALPNLYRNTEYEYRLVADGAKRYVSQTAEFTTADYVRTISMGGIANVRDMGGYKTSYGKRTKQGLIYRGYEIIDQSFGQHGSNYNANVEAVNQEVMKIGVEIDLKDTSGRNGRTVSCLQGADYKPLEVVAYDSFISSATSLESIPQIFKLLANADQEHVYFHCWGGADRTGMVAFFLNAILGVSYTDLIADFEITTETNNKRCHMHNSSNAHFPDFLGAFTKLDDYDASKTINWNCENWLTKHGGVSEDDIEKIRSIMIEDWGEGLPEAEPIYTAKAGDYKADEYGHYHEANEDPNVRCDWGRHNLTLDAGKSTEANCAHEGLEVKSCSICGHEVTKELPKTGHTFAETGANGLVHSEHDDGCGANAYRLDISEATGWNTPTTKWNAKTTSSSNNKVEASWDISGGKIPAGKYEIHLECYMSSSSHSNRYFFNHAFGHPVTGEAVADTGNPPDSTSESRYRYFFKIDDGDEIDPDNYKTWGECGLDNKTPTFVQLVSEVTINADAAKFSAFHGDIGYSLIVSRVRLVAIAA